MPDTRKTILITGCSPGGIGNALAREFHARGLRVFATARKTETISDLSGLGMECLSLVVDEESSVQACFAEVQKRVGDSGLDYLFNNAGRNYTCPALDVSLDEVQATFATNLFAVIRLNAVFAPLIFAAHGTYVHTGSVAAVMPYVWGSVYNASKAALHAYCNTLRVEMAPFDVKVIVVITGGVKSNIARTERTLPDKSVFKPIEGSYLRRLKHSQEVGMDTTEFARDVVGQLLRAKGWLWSTQEVWAGTKAGTVWWAEGLDRYIPGGVMGPVMSWMFGLGKLKEQERRKKIA